MLLRSKMILKFFLISLKIEPLPPLYFRPSRNLGKKKLSVIQAQSSNISIKWIILSFEVGKWERFVIEMHITCNSAGIWTQDIRICWQNSTYGLLWKWCEIRARANFVLLIYCRLYYSALISIIYPIYQCI